MNTLYYYYIKFNSEHDVYFIKIFFYYYTTREQEKNEYHYKYKFLRFRTKNKRIGSETKNSKVRKRYTLHHNFTLKKSEPFYSIEK